jgi:hypothetical protein
VEVGDPGRVVEFVDFRSIVKPGLVGCLGFRRPSEETVDLYSFLAD